jgi:polar amino acid transport system substrate-binding protein
MRRNRRIFPLILLIFITSHIHAQPLRVGSVHYPPFGQTENKGICPDIWQAISEKTQLAFTYEPAQNVNQTLHTIAQNELDVAIGPISITAERLQSVSFTLPYYQSDIGLLIPPAQKTLWDQIRPFLSMAVFTSIALLLMILFVVGNIVWFVERKANPSQFPPDYLSGVGNGMWFALVTLTTVGYGDRAPLTTAGRIVAGTWMVVSMIIVSSLIAGLASAFTVTLSEQGSEAFTSLEDLRDRRIAVVSGTTSAQHAANQRARLTQTNSLDEAVNLLKAGQVEAVAFGKPLLSYHLKKNPELTFRISNLTLATEDYGFALPINSPHLHTINLALKELEESGRIETIINTYLY